MKYALLGDLHSNVADTQAVLSMISEIKEPVQIIGLGDLYECKVSKKKAAILKNVPLEEAAEMSDDFNHLLTFPSIRGNQEERISKVTGLSLFSNLPETLTIEGAQLIHGHQFKWSKDWEPIFKQATRENSTLIFFGHSHSAALYKKEEKKKFKYGKEIELKNKFYGINVGSVVDHREWCLYDAAKRSITFMKATY